MPGTGCADRARRVGCAAQSAAMRTNTALHVLLARQDGLITDAPARTHGVSERTLRRRACDDGWTRVAPGVLLAAGHPRTDRARVRAAGLWASGRGVLSGPAAAWWHGMLAAAPDRVELTVARRCGLRSRDGVRIRRRDLDRRDVVAVDGLVVMAKPLAALETAAVVADGSAFLDRALRRHVGFESVYQSYCRNLGPTAVRGSPRCSWRRPIAPTPLPSG